MKKLIFSLVATAMISSFGFANSGEPIKEKKEVKTESKTSKENNQNVEEVKTATCSATIGGSTYTLEYSCFFCWGGADNGCKAALLDSIDAIED
ncbi:hypothetical protein FLGE108171_15430 [Flavobacterium gelidilacus]|uniref:hypothetical protein n=1 Tax=Flavobacterium gelidilacus TaxID=206041 RepID=UPI0003F9F20F|nr:hypothetical protein [Flavobacterium gelidilacus]